MWSPLSASAWHPWLELSRMQSELDRLFAGRVQSGSNEFPPIDVWSGENGLRIFAELAGFEPAQIEISVVGDTLTLKGARPEESTENEGTWHRQERGAGHFVRTLQLPFAVEPDAVKATFKNGMLDVDLPRAASERPRKIQVQSP